MGWKNANTAMEYLANSDPQQAIMAELITGYQPVPKVRDPVEAPVDVDFLLAPNRTTLWSTLYITATRSR
jgi:hypothetical protein